MQKSDVAWRTAGGKRLADMEAGSRQSRLPRLNAAARAVVEWATVQEYERLLDLSCSDGALLEFLTHKYRLRACGITENIEDARAARELITDADILPGRPVDIPWQDGAFDIVLCAQPANGFSDFESVLKEVKRVLRRGGQFVIYTPYVIGDGCTPRSVMRRMQAAGFKNVSWRTYRLSGVCIAWRESELS